MAYHYLTGRDPTAIKICEAFHLKIEGLVSIDLHLNSDSIAVISAVYHVIDPDVPGLTEVLKKYELVEITDDGRGQGQDQDQGVVQG